MKLWARVAVAVLLVAVLFGTFVHYDVTEDRKDPYPSTEDLAREYDANVGERTLLFGTVQSVGDDQFVVRVESDVGSFEMTVSDAPPAVEAGGVVQVYGTLAPDRTIRPTQIEVVNRAGSAALYKYAVSGLGALLVVGLFFRHWTIDTDEWAFEVRTDG